MASSRKRFLAGILARSVSIVLICSACDPEPGAWREAQSQNTIESLEQYLQEFPDGLNAVEAHTTLASLIDTRDWNTAEDTADVGQRIEAYQVYLDTHPNGEYTDPASTKLDRLSHDQAWNAAISDASPERYREFLEAYGESSKAAEAQFRSELLKAATGHVGLVITSAEVSSLDDKDISFEVSGPLTFGGRALSAETKIRSVQSVSSFAFLNEGIVKGDTIQIIGGEKVIRFVMMMPMSSWSWLGGFKGALPPPPPHGFIETRNTGGLQDYIASGASLDVTDILGRTALFCAIESATSENDTLQIVELLIEAGANINKPSLGGKTPLMLAFQNEHKALGQRLIDAGADVAAKRSDNMSVLHFAARLKADADFFASLARSNPNIDLQRDLDLATPLHMAVLANNLSAVQGLLDSGADPNPHAPNIRSALEFAEVKEFKEIAALLRTR